MNAEFTHILTQAVEASVNPQIWDDVCDHINAYSGGVTCTIMEYDPIAARGLNLHSSTAFKEIAPDLSAQFIDGGGSEDNEVYFALQKCDPLTFLTEAAIMGVADNNAVPSNRFREAVLERTGAISRNGGRLNDIGPYVDALALHLNVADDLPAELVVAMGVLMPVIGKSIESGRIVRTLTHGYGALLDAFDMLDFGAAICGPEGRVVLANSRFREMGQDGDAFRFPGDRVLPTHADDGPALTDTIADSQKLRALPGQLITTLRRRSGKRPLVVKAAPIRSSDLGRPDLTLVLFLDPDDTDRLNASGLEAFGLLSAAELDICGMLVQGYDTSEISAVRDTSVQTVRTQIKSMSAKLACTSRLDLLRLAMATNAPLRKDSSE